MPSKYEKLLDNATSSSSLEPDYEAILYLVDAVRAGDFPAKVCMAALLKSIKADNAHKTLHALMALDLFVKNCGSLVHVELATKTYMETLKQLAMAGDEKQKEKILIMLQSWARAFSDKPEYSIVKDTVELMKMEGFTFPNVYERKEFFDTAVAPEWVDADRCYRCRIEFGMLTRKHHCRNCGQIFCDKCSGRSSLLSHLGIEKEVRVCESCFDKINKTDVKEGGGEEGAPPPASGAAGGGDTAPSIKPSAASKSEDELREQEELQLALALSQSEEEAKTKNRSSKGRHHTTRGVGNPSTVVTTTPIHYKGTADPANAQPVLSKIGDEGQLDNSELSKYLNRQYWENRKDSQKGGILRNSSPVPSAPAAESHHHADAATNEPTVNGVSPPAMEADQLQNGAIGDDNRVDGTVIDFANTARANIEVFVNRIRSNQARGRSVLADTTVQNQFLTLNQMHGDVLKHLQGLDDKRSYYESLQDKMAQIKDAREALNALREEHELQRQRELEEQARTRQQQMNAKLQLMRQQKHQLLEHQRLLAIQRMQQQELELQMRKQQAMGMGLLTHGSIGGPQLHGAYYQQAGVQGMPQYQPPMTTYGYQQPVQGQQQYGSYAPPGSVQPGGVGVGQPYNMQAMAGSLPVHPGIQHQGVGVSLPDNMPPQQPNYQQPPGAAGYVDPNTGQLYAAPVPHYQHPSAQQGQNAPAPPPAYQQQVDPGLAHQQYVAPQAPPQYQVAQSPATQVQNQPPSAQYVQAPANTPAVHPQPAPAEAQLISFD